MPDFCVRKATPSDLAAILKWLRREHEQGIDGCTWTEFPTSPDTRKVQWGLAPPGFPP
jgi:hypothetical protein